MGTEPEAEEADNIATEVTETEAIETADAEDFELTDSSISDLIIKNDNNQMTQKEFFKVFLMGLQQNITTKQKLIKIEKILEDTDTRLEELEIVKKAASEAPTEPEVIPEVDETPVVEAEAAPVEEAEEAPAIEVETAQVVTEEEAEEPEDITTQVEKVEKTRTSRKRSQKASETQRESRPKRTRVV